MYTALVSLDFDSGECAFDEDAADAAADALQGVRWDGNDQVTLLYWLSCLA